MNIIWATRGRTWGFRFLRDGGFADPLPEYNKAFASAGDDPEVCRRVDDGVALRFPDPAGRRDAAGRLIPHEFVILGADASQITSVAQGQSVVWPAVAETFARQWNLAAPEL